LGRLTDDVGLGCIKYGILVLIAVIEHTWICGRVASATSVLCGPISGRNGNDTAIVVAHVTTGGFRFVGRSCPCIRFADVIDVDKFFPR